MSTTRPLKIVIVGGSIVGLTLANCLEKAGIDYVLLEKRDDVAPQVGAALAIHPHVLRVLDQLGVWERIDEVARPLTETFHRKEDGSVFDHSFANAKLQQNFGYPMVLFQRRKFLQFLYENLSDKSKINVNKHVESVVENPNGVVVKTTDGEEFEGDIVVGADGTWSKIREIMWQNMPAEEIRGEDIARSACYKCLFGISKATEDFPVRKLGHTHIVYRSGASFTSITGEQDTIFWLMYKRLDKTYHVPNIPRYSEEDKEEYAKENLDLLVTDDWIFKDLWDRVSWSGLFAMEERVVERWHHGRIVLLGDSVHRMTVNAGLGANCGIEGIVVFVNNLLELVRPQEPQNASKHAVSEVSPTGPLTQHEITDLFSEYELTHKPRAKAIFDSAAQVTRTESDHGVMNFVRGHGVSPLLGDTWRTKLASDNVVAGSTPLEFIKKETKKGTEKWPKETV